MQDKRKCVLWTAIVFVVAFVFYALTAAFVPVPGISANFMTTLCYPGQTMASMEYPLDAVLGRAVAVLVGPTKLTVALPLLAAFLGALAMSGLFRATMAGVRFSCLDLTGIRDQELPRVTADISMTARLAGLGAAVVGAVSLPLWALGTRPLPGAFSTVLGIALITFAMGVRWRTAQSMALSPQPALFSRVLMGVVFGFAIYLDTTVPMLLPVAVLGIVLAGRPLIDPDTEDRLAFVPWIALGLLGGVALSVLSVWLWHWMFGASTEAGALVLWGHWMQSALPGLTQLFLSFEGAAPLALLALGAALLFGCFPSAYLRFGTPLIGQVVTLALAVAMAFRWPAELWDGMAEPSALDSVAVMMAVLVFALTIGSWARNWSDVHTRWPRARAHVVVALMVAAPTFALAAILAWVNVADGAGITIQRALKDVWVKTDAVLPEATVWWAPPPDTTGFLIRRAAMGAPICPVGGTARPPTAKDFPEGFRDRLSGDVVPSVLATVGMEPLRLYLAYAPATTEAFLNGPFPNAVAATFGDVAERLETTAFGATPMGRRTVRELRAEAARAVVEQAVGLPRREAAQSMHRALVLDPNNVSAALSLEALEPCAPDPNHPSIALLAQERHPWLRAPPPARVKDFETTYGCVQTSAFASARRLWALSHVDREMALAAILAQPLGQLTPQERLLALLNLTEEAAGKRLENGVPSEDELRLYLCVYPLTERSNALFAKHQEILRKCDALALLYGGRGQATGRRTADKMLSFFLRDGSFAYARFHVEDLLSRGEMEEALAFVSGFNVAERLSAAPALAEALRARVLEALTQQNPQAALATARAWVLSNPWQPSLWSLLLANPAQTDGAVADARQCLAFLPLHPEASRRFADALRTSHGGAAADRYLEAVRRAREALIAKDSYAHR